MLDPITDWIHRVFSIISSVCCCLSTIVALSCFDDFSSNEAVEHPQLLLRSRERTKNSSIISCKEFGMKAWHTYARLTDLFVSISTTIKSPRCSALDRHIRITYTPDLPLPIVQLHQCKTRFLRAPPLDDSRGGGQMYRTFNLPAVSSRNPSEPAPSIAHGADAQCCRVTNMTNTTHAEYNVARPTGFVKPTS